MSVSSTSEGSGWRKKGREPGFEHPLGFLYLSESTCVHDQSHNRLDDPEQLTRMPFHLLRSGPVDARMKLQAERKKISPLVPWALLS